MKKKRTNDLLAKSPTSIEADNQIDNWQKRRTAEHQPGCERAKRWNKHCQTATASPHTSSNAQCIYLAYTCVCTHSVSQESFIVCVCVQHWSYLLFHLQAIYYHQRRLSFNSQAQPVWLCMCNVCMSLRAFHCNLNIFAYMCVHFRRCVRMCVCVIEGESGMDGSRSEQIQINIADWKRQKN